MLRDQTKVRAVLKFRIMGVEQKCQNKIPSLKKHSGLFGLSHPMNFVIKPIFIAKLNLVFVRGEK